MKKDYLDTFSTPSGKKVLADLERICFVHKTTCPANHNPVKMGLNEGMRFVVGVHIRNMMNMDINQLQKLIEGEV